MTVRRLEVLLPADVPARDYAAVAHAIWAVLDAAGLDADGAVRTDDEAVGGEAGGQGLRD
ncbi:hypothetical protein LZG04_34430 [Saccharothrix sp. S26]|uniref:hypothetical protein n=1 Tax=Saccharothrix sp. S26 TaxID=2907215 RepID=UPI001F2EF82F|nr:hypothetical protein [Saccharothrix sp. S26]MCE6999874.1 hypothetical protein [Saccharothrix sp. S26]